MLLQYYSTVRIVFFFATEVKTANKNRNMEQDVIWGRVNREK